MEFKDLTNIFIVGAGRAGTTTLMNLLSNNSNICACSRKEPSFFDRNFSNGFKWYEGLYPLKSRHLYTVEASTNYIWYPDSISLIKKHYPNSKIVISLRNPTERAFAEYKRRIEKDGEDRDFIDVFKNTNLLKKRSEYLITIKNIYNYFDKKDVLVLIFEKWINDYNYLQREFSNFLNLPISVKEQKKIKYNKSLYPPIFKNLQKIRSKIFNSDQREFFLIFYIKAAFRHLIDYINHLPNPKKFPIMKNEDRKYVNNYFKINNEELEILIQKDLSVWNDF